jgi:mechanosensitive ion channel-like protein
LKLNASSVQVRFLGFGASSLDVEISAYLSARDWNDFLRLQEELLLEVMDLVQAAGAHIALPSQTMYVTTHADDGSLAEGHIQRFTDQPRAAKPKPKRSSGKPVADQAARFLVGINCSQLQLNTGLEELSVAFEIEPVEVSVTIGELQPHVAGEIPINHRRDSSELAALHRTVI